MTDRAQQASRYLDGDLPEQELEDFKAWLLESPEHAEQFMLWVALDRRLGEIERRRGGQPSTSAPIKFPAQVPGQPSATTRITNAHVLWAASIALVATAVAIYFFATHRTSPVEDRTSSSPIATLIESTHTVSYENDVAYEGSEYASGAYSIESGSAQFLLTNRVTVNLTGATRLVMHHPGSVFLASGSVEFNVPAEARGFTVHLPDDSKIVDLGTAFKVRVGDAGETRLRVTEGSVEWTPPGAGAEPVLIEKGQAAWVESDRVRIASIVVPVGVTSGVPSVGGFEPINLINGSGLEDPDDPATVHVADDGARTMWLQSANHPLPAWVTFDLGAEHDLSGAWIWNLNQAGFQERGIDDFNVYVGGSDDRTATTLVKAAHIKLYPVGSDAQPAEFEEFTASRVRYVRFEITTLNSNGIGLSEVRFEGRPSTNVSDTTAAPDSARSDMTLPVGETRHRVGDKAG